ncbi:Hypothetical predicted protein [Paramuricea clavata]|uniref:Uncharacterized protein n=1 Tax=Paramuricea clavata TaxID=317549 RepID=A0A6S7HCP3_PARCT|nr:Hypothetical predicted protein [Paramuricea clavata]
MDEASMDVSENIDQIEVGRVSDLRQRHERKINEAAGTSRHVERLIGKKVNFVEFIYFEMEITLHHITSHQTFVIACNNLQLIVKMNQF